MEPSMSGSVCYRHRGGSPGRRLGVFVAVGGAQVHRFAPVRPPMRQFLSVQTGKYLLTSRFAGPDPLRSQPPRNPMAQQSPAALSCVTVSVGTTAPPAPLAFVPPLLSVAAFSAPTWPPG